MKVRLIRDRLRDEHEVLEVSDNFYIVKTKFSGTIPDALPKELCEVMPEERWEDITIDCHPIPLSGGGESIGHSSIAPSIGPIVARVNSGYCFRRALLRDNLGNDVFAFIVHKKVSS